MNLQRGLARVFPAYCRNLPATGLYDGATVAAVAEFQRRIGLSVPSGIVDAATRDQLGRYGVSPDRPEPDPVAEPPAPVVLPPEQPAPVGSPLPAAVITYATEPDPEPEHQGDNAEPDPAPAPAPHHELLASIVDAVAALAALLDGK